MYPMYSFSVKISFPLMFLTSKSKVKNLREFFCHKSSEFLLRRMHLVNVNAISTKCIDGRSIFFTLLRSTDSFRYPFPPPQFTSNVNPQFSHNGASRGSL